MLLFIIQKNQKLKNLLSSFLISFLIVGCSKSNNSGSSAAISSTVTICNQIWMTKNLDVDHYRNGEVIPQVTDSAQWVNLTTGAWCYYNNDAANGSIYGKLYNWYAVNDARGLSPSGYHIPTDAEWTSLENCLGGSSIAGGALKEAGVMHWNSPNTGATAGATNSSGFTALPGGDRGSSFIKLGIRGNWWESYVESGYPQPDSWVRYLFYDYSDMDRGKSWKKSGLSVRCVKD